MSENAGVLEIADAVARGSPESSRTIVRRAAGDVRAETVRLEDASGVPRAGANINHCWPDAEFSDSGDELAGISSLILRAQLV